MGFRPYGLYILHKLSSSASALSAELRLALHWLSSKKKKISKEKKNIKN